MVSYKHSHNITDIKVFGERNTSTNALKALIENNSESCIAPSVANEIDPNFHFWVKVISRMPKSSYIREKYIDSIFFFSKPLYFWKHAATNFADVNCFGKRNIIFTVRNPASWLLGLHRRPYNTTIKPAKDFSVFLQSKWRLVWRDNLKYTYLKPIKLYNYKLRSYLVFMDKLDFYDIPYRVVRFEDFALDQRKVFDDIRFMLNKPSGSPIIVDSSTKDKRKSSNYYKEYYGNER